MLFRSYYGVVDGDGNGQVDIDPSAFQALSRGDFETYNAYTNSSADVNSYGAALGLTAKVFGNFDLSGS